MRSATLSLLLSMAGTFSAAGGCGDDGGGPTARSRERGDAVVGGAVVSTVDGRPITLEEVREAASRTGLTPRAALRRLQDQALLAAAAERGGYADATQVQRSLARAAARATLRHLVESAVTPESITAVELRGAYEGAGDRFRAPERRASLHLLQRVASDSPEDRRRASEDVASRALEALRGAADPVARLVEWRESGFEGQRDLVIEEVQPVGQGDSVETPYLDALFELEAPGLVPRVVRTAYGYHVVFMTEIVPARDIAFDDASPELRRDLLVQHRHERLLEVLARLAHEHGVERHDETILSALAEDPLAGMDAP